MHRKKLAIIGIAGLGMGLVFLTAAGGVGGNVLGRAMFGFEDFNLLACPADEASSVTSRLIDWQGGDDVIIKLPANVHYRKGSGEQILVKGSPVLVAHVAVKNGVLAMTCNPRHRLRDEGGLDVTLPGREFRRIELMGAGNMDLAGIDQPSLELSLRGAGNLQAEGKTDDLNVDVRGFGDMDLGRLEARDAALSIRGAGDIDVSAENRLNVDIRGAGDVRLKREPRNLFTNIRGAGSVYHADGTRVRNRHDRDS